MATRGIRPFVAIYSTFLQRAYDNIIHDVAIQSLPVVFCMDRAGLVGEDGETHMGLYDIAYLLAVPEMTVTAPKDATEMLGSAAIVRWPTGLVRSRSAIRATRRPTSRGAMSQIDPVPLRHLGRPSPHGHDVAILAVGTMVLPSLAAADTLAAEGLNVTVVNCRYLKPYDEVTLAAVLADHKHILVVEEGTVVNGFGAFMSSVIAATTRRCACRRTACLTA